MLTLEYSDAAGARRRNIDGRTDLVVGRAPMCDVVIDDVSVSRTHARLRADNGRLVVTDLGSRNGTIVDGVSVRQAELQPGAVVAFGGVPVRVSSATEEVSVSENHVLVDAPETFLQPARDLGN